MTDVLRIALERRDRLIAEIEQLDDFIRMAERLIRSAHPLPRAVAERRAPEDIETPGAACMNLPRRGAAAG